MTTVTHLPLPEVVAAYLDDPNIIGLLETPADDETKIALIEWYLRYKADQGTYPAGWAGIADYWRGRNWRYYGWFGWTRALDAMSALRQRLLPAAR